MTKKLLGILALILVFAAPAAAQTLQTTTLGAAVSSSTATTITVADATVQNGQWVWTDREAMLVTAGGGTTSLTVTRGIGGFASSHLIGGYVYFGPPTFFYRNDPASPSCQVGAPNVWINTDSGGMWSCYANVWRSLTAVGPAPVGTLLIGNGSILPPSFSSTSSGTFTFDRVLVGNGTAALPSVAFASDTDTGIYRIGANNIGIAANGAKVLDITTTGLAVTGTLSATGAVSGATVNASSAGGAIPASNLWSNTSTAAAAGVGADINATGAGLNIAGFAGVWEDAGSNGSVMIRARVGGSYPSVANRQFALSSLGIVSIAKDSTHGFSINPATNGTAAFTAVGGGDTAIVKANGAQFTGLASATGVNYVCSSITGVLSNNNTACIGTDAEAIASIPSLRAEIADLRAQIASVVRRQ